ncbi:MAG: SPOR domain-containing protein [Bacteroidales bacterium]|jgi:cell division septation protein DedD|nr:SPOR domain-containing protein [Bacteroidales bacterium]
MIFYNDIYQLIIENDCVIIPDFGGFLAEYCEAKINFSNQEFIQPTRKIVFNEDLHHNDLLLASYIANKKNITIEKASILIERFVEEIKRQLDLGETVKFYKLGSFSKINGELNFAVNAKETFNEDSYGFSTFVYPYLVTQILTSSIVEKNKKNKKTRRWLFIPAAAAVAGLLFVSFYTDLFKINTNSNLSNIIPSELIKTTVNLQQPENQTVQTIEEPVSDENNIDVETVESEIYTTTTDEMVEQAVIEKSVAYTIAGGFISLDNAKKLQAELISKGYVSEIIPQTNNGLHRVSIKSYISKEDAINDLETIRTQSNYPELWILYMN